MKLEQSFEVDLPLDQVWEALVDVERVVPCLPGAVVTGRNDDGSYNGTFTIKIGPTTASYAGRLEMQDVDEASHKAKMHAQGADRRGQGGATATIESTLSPQDGGTYVEVVTDYHITGRLARFGRGGMIEDISERLLREFGGRLQSSLAGVEAAPAPAGAAASQAAPAPQVEEAADAGEQPTVEQPRLVADKAEATPAPTEAAPPPAPELEAAPPQPAPEPPEAAGAAPPPAPEPPEAAEAAPPPPPPEAPPSPPEAPPPPPPAVEPVEPLDAGPLVRSAVLDRIKRNPAPVVAIVGGLVVIGLLRRRR